MKKLKVPLIQSQRDSRWSNELLGDNTNIKYNIGMYGCLITSYGNYINKNPHDVNEILKANDGFTEKSGNFIWSKCSALGLTQTYLSPYYDGPVTSQGIAKIKELIDGGYPLIC